MKGSSKQQQVDTIRITLSRLISSLMIHLSHVHLYVPGHVPLALHLACVAMAMLPSRWSNVPRVGRNAICLRQLGLQRSLHLLLLRCRVSFLRGQKPNMTATPEGRRRMSNPPEPNHRAFYSICALLCNNKKDGLTQFRDRRCGRIFLCRGADRIPLYFKL